MTAPKAGYKGDVCIGGQKIAAANWTYAGGERQMQAVDELGDEVIIDLPLQIRGGVVTITGNYKLDSDVGQQLVATKFASGDQIANLMLYTDKSNQVYLMPDPDSTPASYATVTNCRNVGDDKSGIGTISMTLLISGVLKQMGAGVQVVSTGIHGLLHNSVGFIGELIGMGGKTPIVCYFEYGTTAEFGADTTPTDSLTKVGMFEAIQAGLSPEQKYYWRAVGSYNGVDNDVFGAVKTFTTEVDPG